MLLVIGVEVTMVDGIVDGGIVAGGMDGTRQVILSTHVRLASSGIRTCIPTVSGPPNRGASVGTSGQFVSLIRDSS